MLFLLRLAQVHESFRKPEIEALATAANVKVTVLQCNPDTPFCLIDVESVEEAQNFASRSVLAWGIYELLGQGADYEELHKSVKSSQAAEHFNGSTKSFRFDFDSFKGKRSSKEQNEIIITFNYLGLRGPVSLQHSDLRFSIFEDFDTGHAYPKRIFFGRHVGSTSRSAITQYDLKKRSYISRTSMDSELSLLTALLALAGPGKLFFDPFVGTGSFSVTCAFFGATVLGSDIDGRYIRGSATTSFRSNFVQYGTQSLYLDNFASDLTLSPLRQTRFLDGIVCDPPYGVREGPKVLGFRDGKEARMVVIDGVPAHLRPGYVAAKRPYGFGDLLQDVLEFAFEKLVDDGRLGMWMPTANDEDIELAIPAHPGLKLISVCVQHFNKWARRLLIYSRIPDRDVDFASIPQERTYASGRYADELNDFRKKYFRGFRSPASRSDAPDFRT